MAPFQRLGVGREPPNGLHAQQWLLSVECCNASNASWLMASCPMLYMRTVDMIRDLRGLHQSTLHSWYLCKLLAFCPVETQTHDHNYQFCNYQWLPICSLVCSPTDTAFLSYRAVSKTPQVNPLKHRPSTLSTYLATPSRSFQEMLALLAQSSSLACWCSTSSTVVGSAQKCIQPPP